MTRTRQGPALMLAGLALALAACFWLALRGPSPLHPAPPTPAAPVTYAPTVEPPTVDPAATAEPVTPPAFYATQQAGVEATTFARATAQPFPTAGAAAIEIGQPSSASARRGGLTLQVRLPKNTYLSGEAGQAEITLSNAGPETVVVTGGPFPFNVTLLDGQGHPPPTWPWYNQGFPGLGPPFIQSLAPGQSFTSTQIFHVLGPAPTYALWVEARFSRQSLSYPDGPENLSLRLEAGPIPLQVLEPAASRQLHAELQADHAGWSLRVTDAAGNVPPGPFLGGIEAASANVMLGEGPLGLDSNGVWSHSWDADLGAGPVEARAWVGAPGYISALARLTVPGNGEATHWFDTVVIPPPQTFETFLSARLSLRIPLYRLSVQPPAATFDSIAADVYADPDRRLVNVTQMYALPSGAWLELDQSDVNPPYDNPDWGDARYDAEAQLLSLHGQPAYLAAYWGWWRLDWTIGSDAFELRAPVGALAPADLWALAGGVGR